jgi:hypothetical protein
MKETPLTADQALVLLRENASRLAALTGVPAPGRLHTAPQPREWSPDEILAHLRACSDVWGGNIGKILAGEDPTFSGLSPRTWMKQTDYPQWQFAEAFRAFAVQREELLDTLDALTLDDWERSATVTAWGQANTRTLRSYASQLAKHERTHVRQMERTLEGLRRISSKGIAEGAN